MFQIGEHQYYFTFLENVLFSQHSVHTVYVTSVLDYSFNVTIKAPLIATFYDVIMTIEPDKAISSDLNYNCPSNGTLIHNCSKYLKK